MNIKFRKVEITKLLVRLIGLSVCLLVLVNVLSNKSQGIDTVLCYYLILYAIFFVVGILSSKNFFTSSYFWFFSFFFLYQTAYPFIIFFGGIFYFSVSLASVTYTSLYSLKFLCVAFAFFFLFTKQFIPNRNLLNVLQSVYYVNMANGLQIVAFFTAILELYYFFFCGLLSFILSGSTTRTDISLYTTSANIWEYIGYLNIYLFVMYIALKKNNIRQAGGLIKFDICFYIASNILSGSRKFVLYIMIILLVFYVMQIFKSKLPLIAGGVIVIIATYQRIFIFDGGLHGNAFRRLAGMVGEFIFPTISFPISYQIGLNSELFNYPTVLDSVLYFIPRSLFPYKNYSIAVVFEKKMNVGMGFASNPMLEAYLNFGEWGWLVEASLIIMILWFITKKSDKNIMLFIFGIIFLIDLNRGEVSYFVRQMLEIGITIYFTNWIAQKVNVHL